MATGRPAYVAEKILPKAPVDHPKTIVTYNKPPVMKAILATSAGESERT